MQLELPLNLTAVQIEGLRVQASSSTPPLVAKSLSPSSNFTNLPAAVEAHVASAVQFERERGAKVLQALAAHFRARWQDAQAVRWQILADQNQATYNPSHLPNSDI